MICSLDDVCYFFTMYVYSTVRSGTSMTTNCYNVHEFLTWNPVILSTLLCGMKHGVCGPGETGSLSSYRRSEQNFVIIMLLCWDDFYSMHSRPYRNVQLVINGCSMHARGMVWEHRIIIMDCCFLTKKYVPHHFSEQPWYSLFTLDHLDVELGDVDAVQTHSVLELCECDRPCMGREDYHWGNCFSWGSLAAACECSNHCSSEDGKNTHHVDARFLSPWCVGLMISPRLLLLFYTSWWHPFSTSVHLELTFISGERST